MNAPLPIFPGRVEHQVDEPTYSLLLRTAQLNGALRPYAVFRRYSGGGPGPNVLDVEEVAATCKCSFEALRHATPVLTPQHAMVMGQTFDRRQFSCMTRRWCPHCLAESPHHRVWWDIVSITTCPFHEVELVDRCDCDISLRTVSHFIDHCNHGHDLSAVPSMPAQSQSLAVDRYIVNRMLGLERPPIPHFDAVDLKTVISVSERVGRAFTAPDTRFRGSRKTGIRREPLDAGFAALIDLDGLFREGLEMLFAQSDGRTGRKWGLEKAYGPFYVETMQMPQSALKDAMLGTIRRHAEGRVVLKGNQIAGEALHDDEINLVYAAQMCGLTFERFRRLAVALGLIPQSWGPGTPLTLDRDAVVSLAEQLKGHKNLDEISAELDASPVAVVKLAQAGFVKFIVHGGGNKRGLNKWIFHRDGAQNLLNRLDDLVPPELEEGAHLAPIHRAGQACHSSLTTMVDLIIGGQLQIKGVDRNATGLTRYLVSKSETQRAIRRKRAPGLNLEEASAIVGVHSQVLASWIKGGLLPTQKVGRIVTVQESDIAEFRRKYATTTDLVKEAKLAIKPISLGSRLKKAGVEPVADRPVFHQVLFKRDATLKVIASWGKNPVFRA